MTNTGYGIGRVTGKRDAHPLECPSAYDLVKIVGHAHATYLECDLPNGHDGDHWDRSWGLEWQYDFCTSKEYDAA